MSDSSLVEISVQPRAAGSSAQARNLRRSGRVPGIIYGQQDPTPVSACAKELEEVIHHPHMVQLTVEGEAKPRLAVVRDHQEDYLGMSLTHVDFQEVQEDQIVTVELSVHLHGEPAGSSRGGQLRQLLYNLEIRVPAKNIPESIDAHVNHMDLGERLRIEDLPLPQGATPVQDGRVLVAQVVVGRN